ncbi:MAG: GNAT family N-acetyltransferase [Anaerolineales bacterium]|nr:GNAT family N-acetyltransferase [Anaerolineales bacterium]
MTNYWQNEKVRLRALEPEDAELFFRWNMDSERARRLDFIWPPQSLASVRKLVEEQSHKQLEVDTFRWIIENPEGVAVGSIDTHHCDPRAGTFSYGVDVSTEHQRRGYAAAAVPIILKYYFEELRYQKVTVPVHSYNQPSIRLHQKLGFKEEGCLRRMGYTNGEHFDVLWFGMTKEEFAETN